MSGNRRLVDLTPVQWEWRVEIIVALENVEVSGRQGVIVANFHGSMIRSHVC